MGFTGWLINEYLRLKIVHFIALNDISDRIWLTGWCGILIKSIITILVELKSSLNWFPICLDNWHVPWQELSGISFCSHNSEEMYVKFIE